MSLLAARVAALPRSVAHADRAANLAIAVGLLAGLSAIVGLRWLAARLGLDPLLVGAGFGLALTGLLLAARPSPRLDPGATFSAIAAGIAFGGVLVVVAVLGAAIGGSPVIPGIARPAAPFLPWAAATLVVAAAEEGILRGVLLDRLRAVAGLPVAIAVPTVIFALIHVPLYGWHVVPLDLAVGLGLAGLRLSTRTIAAPIAAHAVADLATWWL